MKPITQDQKRVYLWSIDRVKRTAEDYGLRVDVLEPQRLFSTPIFRFSTPDGATAWTCHDMAGAVDFLRGARMMQLLSGS